MLALYCAAPRRLRHLTLTLASFVFYGWANPLFLALMILSTAIDYGCGLVIAGGGRHGEPVALLPGGRRTRAQSGALWLSILSNLTLLGFFKYYNFATTSFDAALAQLGLTDWQIGTTLHVVLPLGISFYTFQSMSYSIDVYRGDARAIRNPIDFACYVSMFPQLVAGPIIRFSEVAEQLRHRTHGLTMFARGCAFVALGLGKKVLLANPCGKVADLVFNAGQVECVDAWIGTLAYSFQIYFDFSGYSDMAIGLGLMLGFRFAKNFDSPYRSESITEFWRRWHISLSTWLRDYLYVPLGGNRRGPRRTYVNLAIVMLLGGLWHGAAWTFVVWGALHGAWLAFERSMGRTSPYQRLPRPLRVALTFGLVMFAWVFFRAPDLHSALTHCGAMLGLGNADAGAQLIAGVVYEPYHLLTLGLAAIVVWGCPQAWDLAMRITPWRALWILAVFWLALVVMTGQSFNPFIYFIF